MKPHRIPGRSPAIQGFTLVELSIVLVIMGLLVGGVLSGQSLIRAAEIRSVISDDMKFSTAMNAFKDKYFALPGDMTNATAFWGIAGGTTGADTVCRNAAISTKTCNGDGDGYIIGLQASGSDSYNETYRAWQQLANAGLIEGSYTGTQAINSDPTATQSNVAGVNVPTSKIGGGGLWTVSGTVGSAGDTSNFALPAGSTLGVVSKLSGFPFTPAEAWNIDTKLDDGLPGGGKVVGSKGTAAAPSSTAAGIAPPGDTGATYNLGNTSKITRMSFYF